MIENSISSEVKGHFYKIKDETGKTRGYLFGTVHVFDKQISNMNIKINRAIDKSDGVFLEHDEAHNFMANYESMIDKIIKSQPQDVINKSIELYLKNIKGFTNDIYFSQLENKVQTLNTTEAFQLCQKKYFEVLGNALGSLDSNGNYIPMIDLFLQQKFTSACKPVFGLVSFKEHSQYDPLNENQLAKAILYPGNLTEQYQWISDVSKIWAEGKIFTDKNEIGSLGYRLLEERSGKFTKVIYEDLFNNKKRTYAFGFSHLYDSNGVIQGLEKRGLKVIRVE